MIQNHFNSICHMLRVVFMENKLSSHVHRVTFMELWKQSTRLTFAMHLIKKVRDSGKFAGPLFWKDGPRDLPTRDGGRSGMHSTIRHTCAQSLFSFSLHSTLSGSQNSKQKLDKGREKEGKMDEKVYTILSGRMKMCLGSMWNIFEPSSDFSYGPCCSR